jgi:hypothetical protein
MTALTTVNDSSPLSPSSSSTSQRQDTADSHSQPQSHTLTSHHQQRDKPLIPTHLVTADRSIHYKEYGTVGACDLHRCQCYAYMSTTGTATDNERGTGICRRCHHPSIYHQVYTRQHKVPNKKKHVIEIQHHSNATTSDASSTSTSTSNTDISASSAVTTKNDNDHTMNDATSTDTQSSTTATSITNSESQTKQENDDAINSTTNSENTVKHAQSTEQAAPLPDPQSYVSHPINTFPCSVDGCDCKKNIEPSSSSSSTSSDDAAAVRLCRNCKHAEFYHIKIVKQKTIATRNNKKKNAGNTKKK